MKCYNDESKTFLIPAGLSNQPRKTGKRRCAFSFRNGAPMYPLCIIQYGGVTAAGGRRPKSRYLPIVRYTTICQESCPDRATSGPPGTRPAADVIFVVRGSNVPVTLTIGGKYGDRKATGKNFWTYL